MHASRGIQGPGDAIAFLLENSVVRLLARQLPQRPRGEVLPGQKMERRLQGPASELSLSQNHHHRVSPMERETDRFGCGVKRRSTSSTVSASREKSPGFREASERERNSVELNGEGGVPTSGSPVRQSPCEPGRASAPPEEEGTGSPPSGGQSKNPQGQDITLSLHLGWRGAADEEEELCRPPSKPPAPSPCSPGPRDRSADVIEYIVKELQGISRIQTEIAELQQHLTLIKGSVDEVSSCVDTVLSEIEGLQNNSGPPGKASPGPKAGAPSKEPVLYFYGIPEQEGEDTKDSVYSFLSKYRCFNGLWCGSYIRDASRAGRAARKPFSPRPVVVKLTSSEQRDFILQKSILLQSAGVTVVAGDEQGPPNGQWGLGVSSNRNFQGGAVRTEGDGQLQMDSCQVPDESASQAVQCKGSSFSFQPASALVKKSNLIAELEKMGRAVQIISSSEPTLHPSRSPPCVLDVSPKLKEDPWPKNHDGNSWPSAECLELVGQAPASCQAGGLGSEAENATKDGSSPPEEDRAGGQTPGGSETDCDVTTLEYLSPEQVGFLEEAPVAVITPGYDGAVHKLVGSSEALKDMVQIELNEQDPAEQVFRDVLENSQYFLEHSRDSVDLVDMRFYTSKLGKALNHFRSALQVVFHKLEAGEPDALLEGDKSILAGTEPAPALCGSGIHGSLESVAESPLSPSSESQANLAASSESAASVPRALPAAPSPLEEAPDSDQVAVLDSESATGPPLSSEEAQEAPSPVPQQPSGCRPMSLEKVCAETIYLNRCINNFKNVLREKRHLRRKLLKDLAQEASWTSSAEELHSGTQQG